MESFLINNTEWITNAWWQDINAKNKREVCKQSRLHYKRNSNRSYDAFCVIESEKHYQAGYVERGNSLPITNQKVLASLFAAKYKTCAIRLVFKTGVWVCAISDGLIEPDSDVFGGAEETGRVFADFYSLREWDEVIEVTEPDQSIELIRTLSLEVSSVPELQVIVKKLNKRQLWLVLGLVALLSVGLIGGKMWQIRKENAQKVAEAARRAAIMKKLDAESYKKQMAESQFKKAWEFEPGVQAVFKYCYAEMSTFPLVEKGWLLDTIVCTKKKVEAKWKRLDYARFTDLPAKAVFDANDPGAKQALSEWSRDIRIPARKPGSKLLNKSEGAAYLYQIAKDYQFGVSASWPEPEVKTIRARESTEKPKKIVSPYKRCIWKLTGEYRPDDEMMRLLSQLPGMMLQEVVHTNKEGQWIIKGEFYVL